jgi:hypothetical protein
MKMQSKQLNKPWRLNQVWYLFRWQSSDCYSTKQWQVIHRNPW